MAAITRIIRFVSDDGGIFTGESPGEGTPSAGTLATVLKGSLYDGSLTRTATKKPIVKLLAPVVPSDIFCIGLNYVSGAG